MRRSALPGRLGPSTGSSSQVTAGLLVVLAIRFSLGSRRALTGSLLVAAGVAVAVAVLLLAASAPTALAARDARAQARMDSALGADPQPSQSTLLIADATTDIAGPVVRIRVLAAGQSTPSASSAPSAAAPSAPAPSARHGAGDGGPPVPPGLSSLPRPGQMALSPALRALLSTPGGAVLHARLPYLDVATVGPAGLLGPSELVAYVVDDRLVTSASAHRIDSFGDPFRRRPLDPVLSAALGIAVAVLLLPIGLFLSVAARFGAERRERRLSGLRLLGLSPAGARLVSGGEGLVAGSAGLLLGAVLFLVLREGLRWVSISGISVFPSDAVPSLTSVAVVALGVPVVCALAGAFTVRGSAVDPLGTTRSVRAAPRRATWRSVVALTGALMLTIQVVRLRTPGAELQRYPVIVAVIVFLLGMGVLLPWLTDLLFAGSPRGPLAWVLAVRRLQAGSTTTGRVVSGVAVALAGVLALQVLFASLSDSYTGTDIQDSARASTWVQVVDLSGPQAARTASDLDALTGVHRVRSLVRSTYAPDRAQKDIAADALLVGDCAALAEVANLSTCTPGDVFVTAPEHTLADQVGEPAPGQDFAGLRLPGSSGSVGDTQELGLPVGDGPRWSVPDQARVVTARPDPTGMPIWGAVLATPEALDPSQLPHADLSAFLDAPGSPAIASVVSLSQRVSPVAVVQQVGSPRVAAQFDGLRRALTAAAGLVALAAVATLLVAVLDQLRERRAALAALAAMGTPGRTVELATAAELALPLAVAITVATASGTGLGAVLAALVRVSVTVPLREVVSTVVLAGTAVSLGGALLLPLMRWSRRPDHVRAQ